MTKLNNSYSGLSKDDADKFVEYMGKIENIAVNYISSVEANCLIIDMMMMFQSVISYEKQGIDENE